jgi:PAS domain S-box
MTLNTEELYRNLFETSKDSIFIVKQDTGNIVDVNTSACQLYGYTKEEFLKLNVTEVSAEPEKTLAAVQNLQSTVGIRYHCKKDGTKFPVEISVSYFKQEGSAFLTAFIKDMTEFLQTKQDAKTSHEKLEAIFEVSPLAIVFIDHDNIIRMWNRSAERIFGWTADEVIGKPNPIVPKERDPEYNALTDEIFKKGAISGREIIRQKKDGTLLTLSISSSAVFDHSGQIAGRMAILEDITKRKQMEESLKENETIFSSFLEHSPIYVFFKDKKIRAIHLSRNFEQMLGMPVEQALGKTMDDLFPSDLAKSMVADDMKILNEGKRVEIIEELNGKVYNTIKFPILKNGKPVMLAGFTQDITEKTKMTEELEMLKHSIDMHFDGAYWMDTQNRFIYINDAGCKALQYSREELLQMTITDINPSATPERMEKIWKKLRNEGSYTSETVHRRKDGSEFPVEISSTLIRFANKEYNCGFARDITDRKELLQTLRMSEEKFAKAFMASPEAMTIASLENGTYIDVNENFLLKTGLTREEVINHTSTELNFWVDPSDRVRYIEQLKTNGQLQNLETRFRLASGEIRNLIISSQIIELNKIPCSLNYIVDITERKKAEKQLIASEALLSSLVQNRKESIWSIDKNHKYVIINDMFRKAYLSAFGAELKPGMDAYVNLPPEVSAFWRSKYEEALSGQTVQFEFSETVFNELRYFSVNITPIIIDKEVIGASGISIDMTLRKKGEETLRLSEEKYRQLFENMTVGFALHEMIFDENNLPLDYRFIEVNPAFERLTGLKACQIIGKTVREVIPEIEQHWIDFYGAVAKSGIPASYQNFSAGLGKYYDVWVFNPKQNHFATIINDITEHKLSQEALKQQNEEYQSLNEEYIALNDELLKSNHKLEKINADLEKAKEKAEESDHLKTAFLCNMSHEIRTPMNAILGFSDFITQPGMSEVKKARYSKLIKDRGFDLLRIIEDILDISKIEIGQMKIVYTETDIKQLLMELWEYYKERKNNQKPDADLDIQLSVSANLDDKVFLADGQRLKQILTNLLDNALKFTHKGIIQLSCSITDDEHLLFTVRDTGIGIPPEKLNIIFDSFRQAEEVHSARRYGGTGLGLSIAKGLVQLMGGRIWVESILNEGSKFHFTLPSAPRNIDDIKQQHMSTNADLTLSGKVILIVEDDETSSELLKEIFEETGAEIINAYNGLEALSEFQKRPKIDLVLLDIRLPDLNGLDLARQMKELRPEIPVIAQTAYASESDHNDCLLAGCDGYVSKPIQQSKLFKTIAQTLNIVLQ